MPVSSKSPRPLTQSGMGALDRRGASVFTNQSRFASTQADHASSPEYVCGPGFDSAQGKPYYDAFNHPDQNPFFSDSDLINGAIRKIYDLRSAATSSVASHVSYP
jgi:hypothetical protein